MKHRPHSLQWWFGLVFFLFFAWKIVDGIVVCSGEYAVCPGDLIDDWDPEGDDLDEEDDE
jgi:hypothetical protein